VIDQNFFDHPDARRIHLAEKRAMQAAQGENKINQTNGLH